MQKLTFVKILVRERLCRDILLTGCYDVDHNDYNQFRDNTWHWHDAKTKQNKFQFNKFFVKKSTFQNMD